MHCLLLGNFKNYLQFDMNSQIGVRSICLCIQESGCYLGINVVTIIVVCTQRILYYLFAKISVSQANVTVRVA